MTTSDRPGRVRPTPETVGEFVAWVASAPYNMVDEVRAAIANECDEKVVDGLGELLLSTPDMDHAHAGTLLAVLGESRHPAAVQYLREFVWNTDNIDPPVAHADMPPLSEGKLITCDMGLPRKVRLRARAAEMLCYIKIGSVFEDTLQIIVEHPEPLVRHAAIDAYLYNHEDSGDAQEQVRRVARKDDLAWVGLPRRTADMDASQFNAKLAELHGQDPPPPLPYKEKTAKG
ncbi:hypothetical protein [Rhodococcus wratislaviensis]|uniref:hypothetical protein n=1 Tax=Rhodococcus wratislaviensis TaxID=44752 RepID=UPI00365B6FB2